jgi:hypothetical protein
MTRRLLLFCVVLALSSAAHATDDQTTLVLHPAPPGPLPAPHLGRVIELYDDQGDILATIPFFGDLEQDLDTGEIHVFEADLANCPIPEGPEMCDPENMPNVGSPGFLINGQAQTLTVQDGDVLMPEWNSLGAWSCEASGTFPGWDDDDLPPRSDWDAEPPMLTTSGLGSDKPYLLRLRCRNGPGWSDDGQYQQISVTVTGSAPAPECSERLPPAAWTRLTTGPMSCLIESGTSFDNSADCREWTPGIWPQGIFQSSGQLRTIAAARNDSKQYVAIRFSTDGMTPTTVGSIMSSAPPIGNVNTRRIATISSCLGDFHHEAVMLDTGCYFEIGSFGQSIIMYGGTSTSESCRLQPGQDYYLNIIPTFSSTGTHPDALTPTSACGAPSACANNYQPFN